MNAPKVAARATVGRTPRRTAVLGGMHNKLVFYPGRLFARSRFGFLWLLLSGAALLFGAGCSKQQTLQALFQKSTPHQA